MIPCFFGPSQTQLYGVYTPAAPTETPCGAAVLICPPIGQEYMRSHWLLRTLARKLGERGVPCFRFDYAGTGDSSGTPSFDSWKENIRLAEEELKARSEMDKVVILGLRFGGTLAFLEGGMHTDCPLLILWDPILSGADYLDFLRKQDRRRRSLVIGAPTRIENESEEELRGFVLPRSLVTEISALSLHEPTSPIIPPIVIVSSENNPNHDRFAAMNRGKSVAVRREIFAEEFAWESLSRLGDLITPGASLEKVIQLIEEETAHE